MIASAGSLGVLEMEYDVFVVPYYTHKVHPTEQKFSWGTYLAQENMWLVKSVIDAMTA